MLRHAAIAMLAGFSVFMLLQGVAARSGTRVVVVAAHALARGDTLTPRDVVLREEPVSALWDYSPSSPEDVADMVLQLDVPAGVPILTPMLSPMPVVPEGFTAISVSLASVPMGVTTGMTVSLVASSTPACADEGDGQAHTCTVSSSAIVLGPPGTDDLTAASTQVFAMPPEDAVAVMAAQQAADIMVVSHAD